MVLLVGLAKISELVTSFVPYRYLDPPDSWGWPCLDTAGILSMQPVGIGRVCIELNAGPPNVAKAFIDRGSFKVVLHPASLIGHPMSDLMPYDVQGRKEKSQSCIPISIADQAPFQKALM